MVSSEQQAMINRAVRSIRNELEYLSDLKVITPQQLSSILAQVPTDVPVNSHPISPLPSPVPTNGFLGSAAPPINPSLHEKQQSDFFAPSPAPALPPPAYTSASAPPTLAMATALYDYKPSDAGDLALLPHDQISITEFMNAEWAKGRNQRTGLDGIFPRSYVNIVEHEDGHSAPPRPTTTSNYGNLPLDVSQSGSSTGAVGGKESKLNQNGKKFGKKLGNATIFGAGATIGSNIVNGIF